MICPDADLPSADLPSADLPSADVTATKNTKSHKKIVVKGYRLFVSLRAFCG